MQFRACGCVVSYRFEIGLRDLEIGIGTEVGFSNRRDVEISPFSFVKRLDEIAPTSAGPNHVRFRIQKAQKVGCDSEISLAFRPAVGTKMLLFVAGGFRCHLPHKNLSITLRAHFA